MYNYFPLWLVLFVFCLINLCLPFYLSSRNFIVLPFPFKHTLHLEFIFGCGVSFSIEIPSWPVIYWKVFFVRPVLCSVCFHICFMSVLFLWSVHLPLHWNHIVLFSVTLCVLILVIEYWIRRVASPTYLQDFFGSSSPFAISVYILEWACTFLQKNFDWDCLQSIQYNTFILSLLPLLLFFSDRS